MPLCVLTQVLHRRPLHCTAVRAWRDLAAVWSGMCHSKWKANGSWMCRNRGPCGSYKEPRREGAMMAPEFREVHGPITLPQRREPVPMSETAMQRSDGTVEVEKPKRIGADEQIAPKRRWESVGDEQFERGLSSALQPIHDLGAREGRGGGFKFDQSLQNVQRHLCETRPTLGAHPSFGRPPARARTSNLHCSFWRRQGLDYGRLCGGRK